MCVFNASITKIVKIILAVIIFTLTGCLARPSVEIKDSSTHIRQNEIITRAVIETAGTGDWLVTRGYHTTDNLVSNATGIPISHAGVYNARSQQVIEAEGRGVHISNLKEFVDKSYRLLIIRPRWQSLENGTVAWAEAEKLVGKSYDFLGTLGFNYPSKYYCSELVISIYHQWHNANEKFPGIIKPGELYLYGTILYDSLPRDEMN